MTLNWTWHENKVFEMALVMIPEEEPDRWQKIARLIPGKSAADVRIHFELLVMDLMDIENGRIELPDYADTPSSSSSEEENEPMSDVYRRRRRRRMQRMSARRSASARSIARQPSSSSSPTPSSSLHNPLRRRRSN